MTNSHNGLSAASEGLPERLRQHVVDDHVRGCTGRQYSCACGYDVATDGFLEEAASEIERLTTVPAQGWSTSDWDEARSTGRILLVWRAASGMSEHVELGKWSGGAWTNTYGKPFSGEPDGWAPLKPFYAAQPPAARVEMAPGHDDLMVTPESIDAFMEANPLPPERLSADSALLEKLAEMVERGQCGDVWDINGMSEDDHARLPAMLRRLATAPAFSDTQLAEWVQRLDWDTGLTTADEIHQLRSLLQHIGIRTVPQPVPMLEQPQYIVEGIILRRLHEKRIEGYTIETAKEIVAALSLSRPHGGGK